jgi:hypothetical protein
MDRKRLQGFLHLEWTATMLNATQLVAKRGTIVSTRSQPLLSEQGAGLKPFIKAERELNMCTSAVVKISLQHQYRYYSTSVDDAMTTAMFRVVQASPLHAAPYSCNYSRKL